MRFAAFAAVLAVASPPALAEDPAGTAPSGEAPAQAPAAAPERPAQPEIRAPEPSSAAPAADAPASAAGTAPEEAAADRPAARRPVAHPWGFLVDAGVPQGIALSATFRPVNGVRLFAGPAWDYVGFGVQGGIALSPWRFAVTPVLTAEAGRYFSQDVSFLAKSGAGVPPDLSSLMKHMAYTYGAVALGLEFGSQDGFSFSFALGLAYVSLDASGSVTTTDSSGGTATFSSPAVRGTLPTVKLGLHYWF